MGGNPLQGAPSPQCDDSRRFFYPRLYVPITSALAGEVLVNKLEEVSSVDTLPVKLWTEIEEDL